MMSSEKKKGAITILGVHPGNAVNGGFLGCLEIADIAGKAGYDFILATDGKGKATSLAEELGVQVVSTRIPRWFCGFPGQSGRPDPRMILNFLRNHKHGVMDLSELIQTRNINVVLANTSPAVVGMIAGNMARCPVLTHVRETMPYQSRWGRSHAKFIAGNSQKIIVNSDSTARAFAGFNNYRKIYDGLNINKAIPTEVEISNWKKNNNINEDRPIVGVLGGVSSIKGHFLLFSALAKLVTMVPDVLVVFAGTKPPPEKTTGTRGRVRQWVTGENLNVDELIKTSGVEKNVLFTGWVDDPFLVLAGIDVLAFPSVIPEGFGRPLVEAALMGKPVVAFDHGPSPEIVDNGKTGLLVPSGDGEAFVEAVASLLLDPEKANELGTHGQESVRERFALEGHAEKVLSELETTSRMKVETGESIGKGVMSLLAGR